MSGIIASDRAINWANTGIPGGIPARATICYNDRGGHIRERLVRCHGWHQCCAERVRIGQTVKLGAGTFKILGTINIPSNVTLRGSGPQSTILNVLGTSGAAISMGGYGSTPTAGNSVNINSGATAGSTSIVVSSAANMAVGRYILVTELNDSSFVTNVTNNGTCTWCDNSMWSGTRVRGHIVEITSVSGTTIGITPGLYSAYSHTPFATPFAADVKNAGVEDLQVFGNHTGASGYQTNFAITTSAYCWIKNVESNYAYGDHVNLQFAYRSEVRDSYFSNAFSHTSGTTDADVLLAGEDECIVDPEQHSGTAAHIHHDQLGSGRQRHRVQLQHRRF